MKYRFIKLLQILFYAICGMVWFFPALFAAAFIYIFTGKNMFDWMYYFARLIVEIEDTL